MTLLDISETHMSCARDLTAIDLFSGIGGFHLAAVQNGITVTFASEDERTLDNREHSG